MAYESELTAAEVKAAAKRFGADLVGIGNMECWEGAPKQNDPRYILSGSGGRRKAGSRPGHVKIDAKRALHHAVFCPVVDLPKPRKPEGRSRGGARVELPAWSTPHSYQEFLISIELASRLRLRLRGI